MTKIRFEFDGIVIIRGRPVKYKKEIVSTSIKTIANDIRKRIIKDEKLTPHERIVVIAKNIKEKEKVLI